MSEIGTAIIGEHEIEGVDKLDFERPVKVLGAGPVCFKKIDNLQEGHRGLDEIVLGARFFAEGQRRHGDKNPFVEVKGILRRGEQDFLVMPMFDMDLRQAIKSLDTADDPLNIRKSAVDGLINGVRIAHDLNFRLNDLKPGNVLCRQNDSGVIDRTVLCDFGAARDVRLNQPEADSMYTLPYVAPEVLYRMLHEARERGYDYGVEFPFWFEDQAVLASDIYSMGIIFYELFNPRKMPYGDKGSRNVNLLMKNHLTASYMPFYHPLSSLVGEMLRKNPADRPTIAEVRSEVDRLWGVNL